MEQVELKQPCLFFQGEQSDGFATPFFLILKSHFAD